MAKRKMPEKKTAAQVIADVDRLFNSAPMQAYHNAILAYIALTLLRQPSDIPEDFTHGITGEVHSTRVLRVGTRMKSKAAGYPVFVDVYPEAMRTGVPTQAITNKADRAGRSFTMMRAELDEGMQVTDPTRDYQFYAGWTVWQLHRRKRPGGGFGWEIEVCNPRTCAFPEMGIGTHRPKRFARRRRLLTSRLKDTYAGKGDLKVESGIVHFDRLSESRPVDESPLFQSGAVGSTEGEDKDEELEHIDYDDGYYLYRVVRNSKDSTAKDDGQIVWCTPNTSYNPEDPEECAALAVVVPGTLFAPGGDGEHMLPVLWSLQQIINSRNLVNDLRMSTALRGKPGTQIVLTKTPQDVEELERQGTIRPTNTPDGADAIVYVTGDQMHAWEVKANEDLDNIDEMLREDEERCVAELVVNTDPEVTANATATASYLNVGEVDATQTSWLQHGDFAWREALTAIGNCMINDDDEYEFTSGAEMRMSNGEAVKRGEHAAFGPDDLDFKWRVGVSTRQESEDQKAKRLMNAIFLQEKGVRTMEQVIEADTDDVTAQALRLRKQAAILIGGPVMHNVYFPAMLEDAVKTGAGVWLPFTSMPELFTGQQQAPASPTPQPTQTFAPAPTNGASGAPREVRA